MVAPTGEVKTVKQPSIIHMARWGESTGGDIALCSQNMFWIRTDETKHDRTCRPAGALNSSWNPTQTGRSLGLKN